MVAIAAGRAAALTGMLPSQRSQSRRGRNAAPNPRTKRPNGPTASSSTARMPGSLHPLLTVELAGGARGRVDGDRDEADEAQAAGQAEEADAGAAHRQR